MPVYFVKPAVAQIMVGVAVEAAVVTQEIRILIYWLGSSTTQPHFWPDLSLHLDHYFVLSFLS